MNYDKADTFQNKRVLVILENGKKHLGKLYELYNDTLCMEIATKTSDRTKIKISLVDVKKIIPKDHIRFLSPKVTLSTTSDAIITKQIETIKQEEEFTLTTRRYKLQVNGIKKRSRWSSQEFEILIATWLTKKTPLEMCPFALVRTQKEDFLLCVDRGHNVHKITKTTNTILV